MDQSPDAERQPSPEREPGFPRVGDVISTKHSDSLLFVVFGYLSPNELSAAAIKTLEDGSEGLALQGSVYISDIETIKDHWEIDRMVSARARWSENDGIPMSPEKQEVLHSQLAARARMIIDD